MNQILPMVTQQNLIPLVAIVLSAGTGLVIAVTAIITGNIRGYREREIALNLIRELLERGLSPDEIARLLQTSGVNARDALKSCQVCTVDRTGPA